MTEGILLLTCLAAAGLLYRSFAPFPLRVRSGFLAGACAAALAGLCTAACFTRHPKYALLFWAGAFFIFILAEGFRFHLHRRRLRREQADGIAKKDSE